MEVRQQIKNLWKALNQGYITENEYIGQIEKMCSEYGTEYIGHIFATMTMKGEWSAEG